jgi:heme A synthase
VTLSASAPAHPANSASAPTRNPLFSALVGLASLAVFLQSVWAGMIIREAKDYNDTWVVIHDWGARTAFVLALAAAVVGLVKLRSRRDLVIGAIVLTVLIFLESYVGGIIGNRAGAIAIHIPLGFAIFALAVWLPLRTARSTR